MRKAYLAVLAFAILFLAARPAQAHRVKVFAAVQGKKVVCRGFFSGGGKPKNCPIKVFLPDGSLLVEGKTDENGRFEFEATVRADLKVVLEAGEGHRAEYTISSDALPKELAGINGGTKPTATASDDNPPPIGPPNMQNPSINLGAEQVRGIVREVIQEELLALREELIEAEAKGPGFTEIIGGIGYIIGIMGIVLYFRSKSAGRRRNPK